jgi:hypothetical protein
MTRSWRALALVLAALALAACSADAEPTPTTASTPAQTATAIATPTLAPTPTPEPTPTPLADFPLRLHVEGNAIVDDAGVAHVLRGVDIPDPVWFAMGEDPDVLPWNERIFEEAQAWGAEIIRLSVHPAVWRRYGAEASLGVLEEAVGWAEAHELYAIIDFHSIGFPPKDDYMSAEDIVFGELYVTDEAEMLEFWAWSPSDSPGTTWWRSTSYSTNPRGTRPTVFPRTIRRRTGSSSRR